MTKPLEHAAALAVVLFFVPMKVTVAGISLYLADLVGIMALGFLGLTACRGQLLQSTVRASGFILVFVAYIALAGVVSNVPVKLVLIEMVQWLSVAAFLGVLHQAGLLASPRFLTLVTVYTFLGALYTAGWHLMYSTVRDFKQLENTKYFFGFTCALLYILRRQIRFGHLMLAIAMVMLLMSGERKALMGVAALVICDFLFCREISHPRSQQTAVALGILGLLGGDWLLFLAGILPAPTHCLIHLNLPNSTFCSPISKRHAGTQNYGASSCWRTASRCFWSIPCSGLAPKCCRCISPITSRIRNWPSTPITSSWT